MMNATFSKTLTEILRQTEAHQLDWQITVSYFEPRSDLKTMVFEGESFTILGEVTTQLPDKTRVTISKFLPPKPERQLSDRETHDLLERSYLITIKEAENSAEFTQKIESSEDVALCHKIRHQIAHQLGWSF
jgi:hypothetical protein